MIDLRGRLCDPRAVMRKLAFATLILAASACGEWHPPTIHPATPIPPYPDALVKKKGPASGDESAFGALSDRILDQWLADDPSFGRNLGLHAWDGKIADYSPEGLKARIERLKKQRADLAAVDKSKLTADEALDHAILLGQTDLFLFRLDELSDPKKRPQFYDELFGVNAYLDRDYAPIEDRVKALLTHEEAALKQVKYVLSNLERPLSKPIVETAIKVYKGYAEYLRGDVAKLTKGVGTQEFQAKLTQTNNALAAEADKIVDHLKKDELPKADNKTHILGPDRFKKLIKVQEGLDVPLADLEKMAEENLAANKKAFEELAKVKKVKLTPTKAETIFEDATKLMEASRKFVIDNKIVTIPSEDQAVIKETPPFMRWNSAFLSQPGPYEPKATTAFYYITKPDPKWPKKEQLEYLMPYGVLLSTTVHEVYPGHFLQGLFIKRAPTRAQKMLGAYSFIEGWAHYIEQMMIEEGFGRDRPESHMGQLSDALLRNCRFVASIGIHTKGMTLAQAERRFIADCKQDKATAREQAIRGTFDPGYFAYTLGKVQILALREEAKKKLGKGFSLQRFHDALLAHGSPPVPLIRDRVLADIGR